MESNSNICLSMKKSFLGDNYTIKNFCLKEGIVYGLKIGKDFGQIILLI